MKKDARIYIAGHTGLVGSALVRQLQLQGYTNLLMRTHAEIDLTQQAEVEDFFAREKPDHVFLAAAKVGGIQANSVYPAEFLYHNLAIATNVIHAAWKHEVQRLLFLGSSCVYPRLAGQPMREEALLTGALEPTNRPYALAKIAGAEMCGSYNRQYGTKFLVAMPTNLYGPGDNYDLEDSHVIPALIRKFCEAKRDGVKEVVVWGTGAPRREFLISDDLAEACVFLMRLPETKFDTLLGNIDHLPLINIGVGEDITIRELAEMIRQATGYDGAIRFDPSKPDGTPQKLLDVSRIHALGWKTKTPLAEGLKQTIEDFRRCALWP